jgi:hypothetical protein
VYSVRREESYTFQKLLISGESTLCSSEATAEGPGCPTPESTSQGFHSYEYEKFKSDSYNWMNMPNRAPRNELQLTNLGEKYDSRDFEVKTPFHFCRA